MLDGRLFLFCRRLTLLGGILVVIGIGGCGSTARNPTNSVQLNATLSVSSSSLSFGNVSVGNSTAQLISLTNTGSANLSISNVSTSGASFSTGAGSNIILTPNQSLTVSVNFVPAAPGNVSGSLVVSSNARNSTLQIPLSGTGTTAASHSVVLSWNPSTSAVIGYFVYRSSVSGGPYTKVTSSVDPVPSFTDPDLASGAYFYVVTSVSENNVESGFSNEVEVIVP
jgi:Abnormal spindle-like microcephaly-assoc'd, ASPM-SPD-2-Hydin